MSERTTYSDLTGAAAELLQQALAALAPSRQAAPDLTTPPTTPALPTTPATPGSPPVEPLGDLPSADPDGTPASAIAAHRELSAALAHLGRVLARRPVQPADGSSDDDAVRPRRRHPSTRTVRDLERRGRAPDWSAPPPAEGTCARSLREAARAIGAAADLWSTHQTPEGAPRSPEASRMRHPAVLGAATREWAALVVAAADSADALVSLTSQRPTPHEGDQSPGPAPDVALAPLRNYPRPPIRPSGDRSVDVTVAHPTSTGSRDPLTRVSDSVGRLRQVAWTLVERGSAPAPALANLAAVGVMLNAAAADALERAAAEEPPKSGRTVLEESAGRARTVGARWSDVAAQVAELRTPHPPMTALQIERLDLARLLEDLVRRTGPNRRRHVAEELNRLADRYSDVARLNHRAFRAAHARGDVHMIGSALPRETLLRRPDLLEAKLLGGVVPAPAAVAERLERAYRQLDRDEAERRDPSIGTTRRRPGNPPAA